MLVGVRYKRTMDRRGFIKGFGALIAAPAIVPFGSLMPVRGAVMDVGFERAIVFHTSYFNGRFWCLTDAYSHQYTATLVEWHDLVRRTDAGVEGLA